MQVFITLDLSVYSLARGVAVAVFAPVEGEGGIALINGGLTGRHGTATPVRCVPACCPDAC